MALGGPVFEGGRWSAPVLARGLADVVFEKGVESVRSSTGSELGKWSIAGRMVTVIRPVVSVFDGYMAPTTALPRQGQVEQAGGRGKLGFKKRGELAANRGRSPGRRA